MRKIILSLSAALLASTPVWAINCQVETNCTTLGYTSSKDEGNCLKCPFGNQWACLKANSYETCEVGDILYSDMTINAHVDSSKTPIGVVFNCSQRLAIALKTVVSQWATENFDVPGLTNYEFNDVKNEGWAGKQNTTIISEYCKNQNKSCPAFEYVNNYKTEGTKAGDWYIPSVKEVIEIGNNLAILDNTLKKSGGTELPKTQIANNGLVDNIMSAHLTSTESDDAIHIWINYNAQAEKKYQLPMRPVLNFATPSGGDDSDTDTKTCKIGDILYSDKTCSTDYDFNKTPIGLIFDSDKRRAMSIDQEVTKAWSTTYFDVPTLSNLENILFALSDWNGKDNTKAIAEYCKSKNYSCPAVEYISSYKTVGTSAGDWYLPALGELQAIYENILILNYGLSKIYNREIPTDNYYHWSSTVNSNGSAWAEMFVNGEKRARNKTFDAYILPVIKY